MAYALKTSNAAPAVSNANVINGPATTNGAQAKALGTGYAAQQGALQPTSTGSSGLVAPQPWLQQGSSGPRVQALQSALKSLGHATGPIDGKFGPVTRGALMGFQKARGLAIDGKYGPQSHGALSKALGGNSQASATQPGTGTGHAPAPAPPSAALHAPEPWLQAGAQGERVKALQAALKSLGHSPGPLDGQFGPKTSAALKAFQASWGIAVDGKYGPQTRNTLKDALSGKTPKPGTGGPAKPPGGGVPVGALPKEKIDAMLSWAHSMVGSKYAAVNPYRFGEVLWPGGTMKSVNGSGSSYTYPKGTRVFDCSGFVVTAFKQIGINLSSIATSGLMRSDVKLLANITKDQLKPGDLITYSPHNGVGHVVIFLGGSSCIEAAGGAGVVVRGVNWGRADAFKRPHSLG